MKGCLNIRKIAILCGKCAVPALLYAAAMASVLWTDVCMPDAYVSPKWLSTASLLALTVVAVLMLHAFGLKLAITPKQLLGMPLVAALLEACLGLWRVAHGQSTMPSGAAMGSFDNPAGFAACQAVAFPILLCCIVRGTKLRHRAAAALGIVVTLAAIAASHSRSAWLSVMVAIAIMAWDMTKEKKWIKTAAAVLLLVLAAIALYAVRPASASGRLLVWRCCLDMIAQKPIFGFGPNGFQAHYMDFQAQYFATHPHSQWAQLADVARHAFNEPLELTVNFGMAGLAVAIAAIATIAKCYRKHCDMPCVKASILTLIALLAFSITSYPFAYPFSWIAAITSTWIIVAPSALQLWHKAIAKGYNVALRNILAVAIIAACMLCIACNWRQASALRQWGGIATQQPRATTLAKFSTHESTLSGNPYFLYNYSFALLEAGQPFQALAKAKKCRLLLADYDLELLLGDAYAQLNCLQEAKLHYRKASNMCPCRFQPLYELMEIEGQLGNAAAAACMVRQVSSTGL